VRPVRQAHNRDQLSGNHVATLRVAHGNDYGDGWIADSVRHAQPSDRAAAK
jgi:hypothetical protein